MMARIKAIVPSATVTRARVVIARSSGSPGIRLSIKGVYAGFASGSVMRVTQCAICSPRLYGIVPVRRIKGSLSWLALRRRAPRERNALPPQFAATSSVTSFSPMRSILSSRIDAFRGIAALHSILARRRMLDDCAKSVASPCSLQCDHTSQARRVWPCLFRSPRPASPIGARCVQRTSPDLPLTSSTTSIDRNRY
jgi:hypothetical protein